MVSIGNPNAAANAYSNMAKTAASVQPTPAQSAGQSAGVTGAEAANAPNFGNFLEDSIRSSISTVKAGERASAAGIAGTMDPLAVTQAVTAARLTLDSFLAVRDAAVSAYDKIQNTQM
ncbi:MAG: flagellar hook-basal body complex protein FliE, partial [Alphaproteobacteria bacterium]|nr:flagellar hook-basal body complex protein FliE [Alphaproteobacteria bacterium]